MNVTHTSSVAAGASIAGLSGPTATARVPKQQLGSEDFMKLLAVQFQSQDPMKPMEDTAFIAQMAQFSALEQSNSLVQQMALLRADQQQLTAAGYLGRRVTVADADFKPVTGEVSAVDSSSGQPRLVVDGVSYPLSAVRRLEPAPVNLPSPQSPEAATPPVG